MSLEDFGWNSHFEREFAASRGRSTTGAPADHPSPRYEPARVLIEFNHNYRVALDSGEADAVLAGRMKHPGTLWLLLPKAVAERLERGLSAPTDPGAPLRRPQSPGSPSAPSPG